MPSTPTASAAQIPAAIAGSLANREQLLARLRALLVEQLRLPRRADELDPDALLFGSGLGLDSVDAVELVVAVEQELGIHLPDIDALRLHLRTLNTLIDYVVQVLPAAAPASEPSADWTAGAEPAAPPAAPQGEPPTDFVPPGVAAIRRSVALSEAGHVLHRLVRGERTFELLDRLLPIPLQLRDAEVRQTLLLDDQGLPVADVYVARHDDDFLLLIDGLTASELDEWLAAHGAAPGDPDLGAEIVDLDATHAALAVDGPFAWELLGLIVGPEVVALPFLSLFRRRGWYGLRVGRTGEFGYHLLVPRADLGALRAELEDRGQALDLGHADLAALDHCALENWFFNIRREGRCGAGPIELQLQWRVSYRKEYVGAAALRTRRERGTSRRLACLVGDGAARVGDPVQLAGRIAGEVVNAARSSSVGAWIALALIDRGLAHPGVDCFRIRDRAFSSRSPPLLANFSLFVDPRRHRYASRHTIAAPAP